MVGELVRFLASVNHTGTSSMEIGIKVVAEDIRARVVRHVNSCFTMVAVDDLRRPVAVPPRQPATPDERRRHAAALVRKQLRRKMQQRAAALHVPASTQSRRLRRGRAPVRLKLRSRVPTTQHATAPGSAGRQPARAPSNGQVAPVSTTCRVPAAIAPASLSIARTQPRVG